MTTQNAARRFQTPSQISAKSRYPSNRKPPTYVSFMAMRDWTKNIPSARLMNATSRPTVRRRKSTRTSRKRQAAINAPKKTPTIRHEKAYWPTSTDAI